MNYFSRTRSILRIVFRSLRQHALSTAITIISVALASGLVMSVMSINTQTYNAFTSGGRGFDAVLGGRGSSLQLVLNSVFHLETSPGNIPWTMYQALKNDKRVTLALPYVVGDNFRGFRIVGTTEELFTQYELSPGEHLAIAEGKLFDLNKKEAVIGSEVARRSGLKVGMEFKSTHGLGQETMMEHVDRFRVAGILQPTNGPMDGVVWIPIEAAYRMQGHSLQGAGVRYVPQAGQEIPDEHKEVSAVMIKFKNPASGMDLSRTVNRQGTAATLAWPIANIMTQVFEKMGWVSSVLTMVAYLVMLVAAGSIMASIYNTMNERKREFAILRAIGAGRTTISSAIILEAATIGLLGSMAGFVVYALLLAGAQYVVRARTGVLLDVWTFDLTMVITPPLMIAVAALASVVPAIKAYTTDVATNLVPAS